MEVYCDYDAARLTDDKKEYARTLVKAASAYRRFVLGTTSFIGGKKEAAVRVKALAAFKKPKAWIVVLAAVVLCVSSVCLVLNPRSSNECTEYFDSFKEWTPELKAEFEASEFWREYREAGFTVDNYMTPVKLYQPEVINEGLMYYAGITLDEIRADYSEEKMNRCYVKKLDRFVTFT